MSCQTGGKCVPFHFASTHCDSTFPGPLETVAGTNHRELEMLRCNEAELVHWLRGTWARVGRHECNRRWLRAQGIYMDIRHVRADSDDKEICDWSSGVGTSRAGLGSSA